MTSNDLHEITFFWPRSDAKRVVVTGTFDNWSKSLQLDKTSTGFSTSVRVPWNSTVAYKYLVDGKWALDETKPRIIEPEGYVNNVYVVPSKPSRLALEEPDAPGGAAAHEKVPNHNGHATLDKIQQGYPSQPPHDSSVTEAMTSVPTDREHTASETTVGQDVVPEAVEKTAEEQREGGTNSASPLGDQPAELPAQGAVTEPGAQTEGVTTKAEEDMSQNTPPSPKRPIRMPFVPVNVPSEDMTNGHLQGSDEAASTHKPLGPVNKPAHSPSAMSESIGESEQPESKIPTVSGEPEGEKAVKEGNGVPPPLSTDEQKAPEEVVPPKEEHAVPQTQPVNGKSTPANGTLASRSSDATSFDNAHFPRASRESSDSRPKSPLKGAPRKKRQSFIQKIKHIFAHDKGKK